MKSWLCYLSPYACGLSVPCRGHSEINNVWSGCLGTNQIIDNWHRCLGVMWRKRKLFWSIIKKTFLWTVNFISLTHKMIYILWGPFLIVWKWNFEWNQNITRKFVATNDTVICFFQHPLVLIPKRKCLVGAGRIGCGESGTTSTINLYTMKQLAWRTWMSCSYGFDLKFQTCAHFIFFSNGLLKPATKRSDKKILSRSGQISWI